MRAGRWGGAGGVIEVTDYASLPASAPDDTTVRVLGGGAAGTWQFVAAVDAYALEKWLPATIASFLNGYVYDGSSNPLRASKSNGETVATLLGRGWVDNSANGGQVVDHANGFRCQGLSTVWGMGRLDMTPVALPNGYVFLILEGNCVTPSTNRNSAMAFCDDSSDHVVGITLADNAVANQWAYYNVSTGNRVGASYYSAAAYETHFAVFPVGPNVLSWPAGNSYYSELWPAAKSRENFDHRNVVITSQHYSAAVPGQFTMFAQSAAAAQNAELIVSEMHAFYLSV